MLQSNSLIPHGKSLVGPAKFADWLRTLIDQRLAGGKITVVRICQSTEEAVPPAWRIAQSAEE